VPIDEMLLARDTAPGLYYIEYVNLIGVLTIGINWRFPERDRSNIIVYLHHAILNLVPRK